MKQGAWYLAMVAVAGLWIFGGHLLNPPLHAAPTPPGETFWLDDREARLIGRDPRALPAARVNLVDRVAQLEVAAQLSEGLRALLTLDLSAAVPRLEWVAQARGRGWEDDPILEFLDKSIFPVTNGPMQKALVEAWMDAHLRFRVNLARAHLAEDRFQEALAETEMILSMGNLSHRLPDVEESARLIQRAARTAIEKAFAEDPDLKARGAAIFAGEALRERREILRRNASLDELKALLVR